ncbi:hypothetical protein MKX03_009404 [Papaver bracteatum]|nr:hypothetical protein MKX03_009404 [Papaver bracteatum]
MVLELEEGWEIIHTGLTKLINILEGVPESPMDADYYLKLYTAVYDMCTQAPPHDFSKQVYERYEGVCNNYLQSKVLPVIQEKLDNVSMLQELVKRWAFYKVLVTKLCEHLAYLDRYHIPKNWLPTLKEVGFGCFRKAVGEEMKVPVRDAVIALINQERNGEEIDQTLLKNVIEIFVDLGYKDDKRNMKFYDLGIYNPYMTYYVIDFETTFLNETSDYYTRKASNWTKEEYADKAEECL